MRTVSYTVLATLFAGCAVHQPLVISSASAGPEEEVVGMASGEASRFYVPVFVPYGIGNDSFKSALAAALDGTRAHSLINVFADRQCLFFPLPSFFFFAKCTTQVTGTAIRYHNLNANGYFEAFGRPGKSEPPSSNPPQENTIPDVGDPLFEKVCGLPEDQLREFMTTLPFSKREGLTRWILANKGKRTGWRFRISSTLSSHESDCITRFLTQYSDYKPYMMN